MALTLKEAEQKAARESEREGKDIYVYRQQGTDTYFTSSSPQMTGGIKLERWQYGDLCQRYGQQDYPPPAA